MMQMTPRTAIHPLKMVAAVGAALLLWGLVFAYASSPAWAADITVNSTADGAEGSDGECTLREAITSANTDTASGTATGECATGSATENDVINFALPGTAPWTVDLGTALPDLTTNIELVGPGADQLTVNGGGPGSDFAIFNVTGIAVSISGITISNGNGFFGGGIYNNGGALTVAGSTVSGNNGFTGAGIFNEAGDLTVTGSTISGNTAGFDGGGIYNNGGALRVTGSTVSGNSGDSGGGVYSNAFRDGLTTTITNSTVSGNTASTRGGGVFNFSGLTAINHSTITNNTAPRGAGSGVASLGDTVTSTEVLSTIVSANTNTDVDFVDGDFNSFFSNGYNLIGDGNATGAFINTGDQIIGNDSPGLGALADNGGPTQTHALQEGSPAIDRGNSLGESKDQRGQRRPKDFGDIDNATGGDGSDIGAFEVQAPQTYTVNSTADTDDGACTTDAGDCTLREAINAANGSAEAADTIDFALPGTAPWTVDLSTALPDVTTNIELVGPGADQLTVTRPDSAERFRIFTVTGTTTEVTMSGMTISNGNTVGTPSSRGGGIFNDGGTLTITDSTISGNTAQDAGAIRNDGTLEVSDSTLSGNTALSAGAIQNVGALEVSNSTFSGNSADGGDGGGIFIQCILDDDLNCIEGTGTATVTDSTFSGNSARFRGGAIANSSSGTLEVSNSTFSDNSAGRGGGAISNQRTLELNNSTISGNSADGGDGGGGILNESAITPMVTDSTISGNTASGDGGGGILTRGALTVIDSTISGNTASGGGGGNRGGGIFSNTSGSQTTTITNSTVSGNTAQNGGGGVHNNSGLTAIEFSTITKNTAPEGQGSGVASFGNDRTSTEVFSSIISGNQGTDVDFITNPFGDTTNTFVSSGYNLIGDGNATSEFVEAGDQKNVSDPKLGALADNGGPTWTHALLAGSPAIDKGDKGNTDLSTDQRGEVRPKDFVNIDNATSGDGSDIGAFEVQVLPPVARNDAFRTDEDIPLKFASADLLANDTDPDGATLAISDFDEQSAEGATVSRDNGTFTYTPTENFHGTDSFTYTVSNRNGGTDTATVTITVTPVNDAPVATDGTASMNEDAAPIPIDLGALVSDVETSDANLTYTIVNGPSAQQGTITGSGSTRTFDSAENFNGKVTIDYKVTDRGDPDNCTGAPSASCDAPKDSAIKSVTITVRSVNDRPTLGVARGGSCGTDQHSGTIVLAVSDVDDHAPPSALSLAASSSNRTLVPRSNIFFSGSGNDPTMTLRSADGRSGTATIEITLSDGELKSTEIVNVEVGTNGASSMSGTQRTDMLFGLGGADVLGGAGAADLLCSGDGVDVVEGQGGDDALFGGADMDVLRGGKGDDRLSGGGGEDELYGEEGADRMSGGSGGDRFSGGPGTDTATDFDASQGDTRVGIP